MGHDEIVPGFNTFTIYQRFRALSYKLTGPLKEKRVTPSIISRLAKIKSNKLGLNWAKLSSNWNWGLL